MSLRSYVWSLLFGAGLLALFVGERLVSAPTTRMVVDLLGVAAVLAGTGGRAVRVAKTTGERRRVEALALGLKVLGVVSLLLYGLQSEWWAKLAGAGLDKSAPKLDGALAALWPAVLALAIVPLFLAELSYASMHRAPRVEANRVRDAALSGVGMACLLVFAFSAYYVAAERDVKADFSWFRTARPGEATRNLVQSLSTKVEVHAFFPPANEVKEQVEEFFTDLEGLSPNLVVSFHDHALEPTLARELGVTGNGTLVVKGNERSERMGMGTELERARGQLRDLDREFQQRLIKVARPKKTVYFTTGHGERGPERMTSLDQRWTIREVRELIRDLNYEVRTLGPAEGLGSNVPTDAGAVLIVGPQEPFRPEELASLERYLEGGGRVLLALDPQTEAGFEALLARYGLVYSPVTLANDIAALVRTHQPSDRANIMTGAYSSHPSVTSLGKLGQRAPLLMVNAGSLEKAKDAPKEVRVDFTVHSHPMTWRDDDGDFENDSKEEPRRNFELAAAVTRAHTGETPETRLLVLADSDALTDPVIRNAGNAYLALDGVKWLTGEEALTGTVNTEEDKPIQHTRAEDQWWFYSTVFLAPLLVLAVGFVATRRKGRATRRARAGEEVSS